MTARWKWDEMSEKQKALIKDSVTVPVTNNEPDSSDALLAKKRVKRFIRSCNFNHCISKETLIQYGFNIKKYYSLIGRKKM